MWQGNRRKWRGLIWKEKLPASEKSGLTIDDRIFIKHSLEQMQQQLREEREADLKERDKVWEKFLKEHDDKMAQHLADILAKEFVNLLNKIECQRLRVNKVEIKVENHESRINTIEGKLGIK